MKKKIAIPTANGKLCSHFGHCERFCFIEIEDKTINKVEMITPPEHEPGLYPKWVREQGATEVICGGIGSKARNLFAQEEIKVYLGAEIKEPEELAKDLINDKLNVGNNSCDH